ncbi:NTP pyrophosphohydrolase [Acrocarpospora corrugata]|uniref:NAD(+) diphosphatase n=1 Tax=Acrocarpospora corrugata TaxID=35763 RepID=A0A5M3WH18_9ACTN|nr:NAD(+) diphosphatase [Acrocarpospora corrugata]GES05638.1 NTP pyrophosphohydrolase [Acrocarpospora corrugata]
MEISEGLLGPLLLARSTIDRSALLRQDAAWLERAWAEEATRVVLVNNGETLVRRDAEGAGLVLLPPGEAPEGRRYLLGLDTRNIAYFAVNTELPELPGTEITGLRQAGALLDDRDSGLLVYAVALEAWHSTHEFCPRCGSRTEVTAGGHVRTCPRDASQHFPRVDPAVIMAVYDDDDRILLARGPQWPEGRMSVLAGFVEPGESLEQAVIREVLEEVGVTVKAPRYLGSQPWPFPRSLMLGFFARAATTELTRDPEEIAEARWFTRAELVAALDSGDLRLPPPVSIARRLIETWYGDTLAGDW